VLTWQDGDLSISCQDGVLSATWQDGDLSATWQDGDLFATWQDDDLSATWQDKYLPSFYTWQDCNLSRIYLKISDKRFFYFILQKLFQNFYYFSFFVALLRGFIIVRHIKRRKKIYSIFMDNYGNEYTFC
jgi:hypothetical protein